MVATPTFEKPLMPHSNFQKILYVEDDVALGRLLQKRLQRHGLDVNVVLTAEEAIENLRNQNYDILLVDHILPGMSGLEFLEHTIKEGFTTPVILLTAGGDERVAVAALEKGAADYAVKDVNQTYIELLPAIMQAAFVKYRLQRENELQRKELLLAIEKAESANQAKSTFLTTMSHEMRTPLNVVIGLAHIMAKTPRNAKEDEMLKTLITNADLLLNLINDLLDIGRIESQQLQLESGPFDLDQLMQDLHAMFQAQAEEKNLEFVIINQIGQVTVVGDRMRLQQILVNLIGNAIKFTPSGKVEISVAGKRFDAQTIDLAIAVRDTGIGIPMDKQDLIFNKFAQADETITRRYGGSGLGLAIAQSLATKMGGQIILTSHADQGSIFTLKISLPLSQTLKDTGVSELVNQGPSSSNIKTVLVVEDYAPNMMVARLMLEDMGFEVTTAENGVKAIERIQDKETSFSAILMDVQMEGMDGYETTQKIRKIEQEKRGRNFIIGVTAHALAGDRDRCLSAGMDEYISKPIHPDILLQKLSKLTG